MLGESRITVRRYALVITAGLNEILLLGPSTSGLQLAQMGSTTSAIGNIEVSATDILEQMLVYIEPALSLYFFFCI